MRTDVGVMERRWVSFLCEPWPDEELGSAYDEHGVRHTGNAECQVNVCDEVNPEFDPFGRLELGMDSAVPERAVVNEILRLVRVRKIKHVGSELRCARARLIATRCHFPHDLAVHEIACAIADFALGDHEGLDDRVNLARSLDDSAFVVAGAMLVALGTGRVEVARSLALQAMARYANDTMILWQVADVFQCVGDFRQAVEAMSALFDLAERANASWSEKRYLASRIEGLSDILDFVEERAIKADDLLDAVAIAIEVARSHGYEIYGVELGGGILGGTILEIHIPACYEACLATCLAMYDVLRDRYDDETNYFICIGYRGSNFKSISNVIDEAAI